MINEQEEEQQEQESQVEDQAQSQENEQEQESVNAPPVRGAEEPQGRSPEERAAEIDHIMSMAASDPSIKDLPEYQEMVRELQAIDESKTQATEDEKEQEKEKGDEDNTLDEDEEKEEAEEDDNDISLDLSEEDDAFGLNKKKGKSKYKFKDEKDVVALIKKKGFKEAPVFFESVDKWRNDSQQLTEVQSKNEQIEQGLSSLPTPIKNAIQAFSESGDWRSAFQSSATDIDFTNDFEDLNKEEVVKHYFKDKYEKLQTKLKEEHYDEEEYEERITDFYESSQRLFDSDKQAIEKRRAEIIDRENQSSEDLKESAISSVNALKKKFPNFSPAQLQKVKQRLVNGDTNSLFISDDKYSEDAAERVAFALFGNKILEARIKKARRAGSNESKEEYFARGNKTVKTKNSQQGFNDKVSNDAANHLKGQFKKDPYS